MQAPGGEAVARRALLALALGVLVADQGTKAAVVARLAEGESIRVIGELLRITHLRNPGAAFGLLPGWGGLLALVAIVGVVIFLVVLIQHPPRWTGLGAAFLAGGASGNLTDRLTRGPFGRGTVVDFLDLSFWPTFNVADSAVTIGAILLIVGGFLYGEGQKEDHAASSPQPDSTSVMPGDDDSSGGA